MQIKRQNWFVGTALLVVAAAITFSARRAEAQYASPVKVMNSTAAPAIGSIMDDPGRIPYQSSQGVFIGSTPATTAQIAFSAVPANHRLVITQIAEQFNATVTNPTIVVLLAAQGSSGTAFTELPPFPPNVVHAFSYYFDDGQVPVASMQILGGGQFIADEFVTLTGYMLDCSAAPCAPIAH